MARPLSELLYKVTYLSTHVAIVQLNTKQTMDDASQTQVKSNPRAVLVFTGRRFVSHRI